MAYYIERCAALYMHLICTAVSSYMFEVYYSKKYQYKVHFGANVSEKVATYICINQANYINTHAMYVTKTIY